MILSIERVQLPEPPETPEELHLWIEGDARDESHRPTLAKHRGLTGESLDDHPEVAILFDSWVAEWDRWAELVKRDAPVRDAYNSLFQTYVQVTQKSEELELVLGVGLLVWAPVASDRIRRHLFTIELTPQLDERTGRLDFLIDEAAVGATCEFDMLDPQQIGDQRLIREVEELASPFAYHPLDRDRIAELAAPVAHRLHFQGRWDGGLAVPDPRQDPVISFAPAIIVRPRTQAGLVRALSTIADQIKEKAEVPAGLLPLLDPDKLPPVRENTAAGALVRAGDDIISPLPLNDVQRRILERVDTHAQTLVQGPPGTGKTHTAAALLTHLLAQGQRVLVTAQADRALHEVRAKLPEPIRSLAVSVIGASRDDLAASPRQDLSDSSNHSLRCCDSYHRRTRTSCTSRVSDSASPSTDAGCRRWRNGSAQCAWSSTRRTGRSSPHPILRLARGLSDHGGVMSLDTVVTVPSTLLGASQATTPRPSRGCPTRLGGVSAWMRWLPRPPRL